MTEKEKMLSGRAYNAADPELTQNRLYARELTRRFNTLPPAAEQERRSVLGQLFPHGEQCHIEPPFYCDYGYNIISQGSFYANFNCIFLDVNTITIGDQVLFGPNVQLYTATHPMQVDERAAGKEMGYPITIGERCWIGGGAIINPGITIGRHSVIGAGSVVVKDIPERVFAAGNPCVVIKSV